MEIEGVDISKQFDNQTFQEIHNALMEHQVIFFHDQEMTLRDKRCLVLGVLLLLRIGFSRHV